MAKSIQESQEKWERKTAGAGSKWKANVQGKRSEWEAEMADFLGVSTDQITKGDEWETEVNAVSSSEFQNSISGKGDKWARRVREGLTEGE